MTPVEQVGRLMGEALARGADREMEKRCALLVAYMELIDLELTAFLRAHHEMEAQR